MENIWSENEFHNQAVFLLDYGFHAPTVYFPLIVHGAIMIEPTETESIQTLDKFAEIMQWIYKEAKEKGLGIITKLLNT